MEPEAHAPMLGEYAVALRSIAISLKRIADAITPQEGHINLFDLIRDMKSG